MDVTPPAPAVDLPDILGRLCQHFPTPLVDAITGLDPGRRLTAVKNVSASEDYFSGHFPGVPVMPGVLLMEALTHAAGILLLHDGEGVRNARVRLRTVRQAKFRRQVGPGDRLVLDVEMRKRRGPIVRVQGTASVDGQVAAEAELRLAVAASAASVHPTAVVHPGAVIGEGTVVGPYASIGAHVRIGRNCRIGASCVVDGWTDIGDDNTLYPMGSFGLNPQDLKFRGEATRLVIGRGNTFREFVTIHRGTKGGGGVTRIGDRNYLMAYSHVAHDCVIGNEVLFAQAGTLGGHVLVDDFATVGAFSGVHQFCRVGRHAFIGGYSVCTKDVPPFSKTVGNRAANFGPNTIGLIRRGLSAETTRKIRQAYRYLLVSKLNTTRALERIEGDAAIGCPEVRELVEFIRTSKRGVILKRGTRRGAESSVDE
ncbi:MAG: acyl-ACP--UDP-N-acetylglucosamine O-acyltransferase [Acidobacteriota bacterium]